MLLFWKDKTIWKRIRASSQIRIKVLLPLFIINIVVWKLILNQNILLIKLLAVSFMSAGVIYTFISIFIQFPNYYILDSYSPLKKKSMYIIQFLAACLGLYTVLIKMIFV